MGAVVTMWPSTGCLPNRLEDSAGACYAARWQRCPAAPAGGDHRRRPPHLGQPESSAGPPPMPPVMPVRAVVHPGIVACPVRGDSGFRGGYGALQWLRCHIHALLRRARSRRAGSCGAGVAGGRTVLAAAWRRHGQRIATCAAAPARNAQVIHQRLPAARMFAGPETA